MFHRIKKTASTVWQAGRRTLARNLMTLRSVTSLSGMVCFRATSRPARMP